MPTRQGWLAIVAGAVVVFIGRLFGVLELYVIGAAAIGIAIAAVLVVRLRPVRLRVGRRVTPRRVHAGDTARVELTASNRASLRTPLLTMRDPVSSTQGASLHLAPLRHGRTARAAYRLPTRKRGKIVVGPLQLTRTDVLGLASRTVNAAPMTSVLVLPRWDRVAVPGSGPDRGQLGQHLRMRALGRQGEEFRSLREYVAGDDLRRIHWRASARGEELKVRETEIQGTRTLAVVLDLLVTSHDPESFERAISAAASIVLSALESGRDVRFSTSEGLDLSPTTTGFDAMLEHLALVEPMRSGSVMAAVGALGSRLHGGLIVLVGGTVSAPVLAGLRGAAGADATVAIACKAPVPARMPSVFVIDASVDGAFAPAWDALVGTRNPPQTYGVPHGVTTRSFPAPDEVVL
ncbi:MAG: DUF58 domain-containing protein [Acidimicrobiia bacterium]